jgi:hypothetical protein
MAKKMSPERHTVYVERRKTDKVATVTRQQLRAVKMTARKVS